jgi:hypothetical protein
MQVLSQARAALASKLSDVSTTFRSVADYSGTNDPDHWPCCDASQPACSCPVTQGFERLAHVGQEGDKVVLTRDHVLRGRGRGRG